MDNESNLQFHLIQSPFFFFSFSKAVDWQCESSHLLNIALWHRINCCFSLGLLTCSFKASSFCCQESEFHWKGNNLLPHWLSSSFVLVLLFQTFIDHFLLLRSQKPFVNRNAMEHWIVVLKSGSDSALHLREHQERWGSCGVNVRRFPSWCYYFQKPR